VPFFSSVICSDMSRLTGGAAGNEGLGMFALSLDWNYVGSGGGSLGALFSKCYPS
jgi:hypothetical protein